MGVGQVRHVVAVHRHGLHIGGVSQRKAIDLLSLVLDHVKATAVDRAVQRRAAVLTDEGLQINAGVVRHGVVLCRQRFSVVLTYFYNARCVNVVNLRRGHQIDFIRLRVKADAAVVLPGGGIHLQKVPYIQRVGAPQAVPQAGGVAAEQVQRFQAQRMMPQLQHALVGVQIPGHGLVRLGVGVEQHALLVGGVGRFGQKARQQLVTAQRPAKAEPVRVAGSRVRRVDHLGVVRTHRVGQADRADDAVGLARRELIDVGHDAAPRVDLRLGQVGAAAHRVFGRVDLPGHRRAHHARACRGKQRGRVAAQRRVVQQQAAVKHRHQILRGIRVPLVAAPQQHGLVQAAAVAVKNVRHCVGDKIIALHHLHRAGVHIGQFNARMTVQGHCIRSLRFIH